MIYTIYIERRKKGALSEKKIDQAEHNAQPSVSTRACSMTVYHAFCAYYAFVERMNTYCA